MSKKDKAVKLSVRMLKEGINIDDALKQKRKVNNIEQKINLTKIIDENGITAYLDDDVYTSQPWWVKYLDLNTEVTVTSTPSCILFYTDTNSNRILVYTFGNGHNILKSDVCEEDFGLQVTLNVLDGSKIKSIILSSPADHTKQKQEISSILSSVQDYDFNATKDLIEKLSGQIKDNYKDIFFAPTGRSSLSLKTKIEKSEIANLSIQLIKEYKSEEYKKDIFLSSINNIKKATKTEQILLDEQLLTRLQNKNFDNVYLADYEIINPEEFYAYKFGRKTFFNLDIYELKDEDFNSPTILNRKIKILKEPPLQNDDASDKNTENDDVDEGYIAWSLKKCLVAEAELNNHVFYLSKGIWYRIEDTFLQDVNEKIKKFKCENNFLGNYFKSYNQCEIIDGKSEKCEGLYNIKNTTGNRKLFDKKLINYEKGRIEICDIFDPRDNIFFHIKMKNSSSSLSHLWNQGVVSERLANISKSEDTEYKKKFNEIAQSDIPMNRKIYFGIISDSEDLPIFSKITFLDAVSLLKGMGCPEDNIKYFYIKEVDNIAV